MTEYINRADLIHRVTDAVESGTSVYRAALDTPSAWIGVEEKLPDVNERVLACVSGFGEPLVWDAVRWNGEEWETEEDAGWEYWAPIEFPVTHWMPLPDPPKEVSSCAS